MLGLAFGIHTSQRNTTRLTTQQTTTTQYVQRSRTLVSVILIQGNRVSKRIPLLFILGSFIRITKHYKVCLRVMLFSQVAVEHQRLITVKQPLFRFLINLLVRKQSHFNTIAIFTIGFSTHNLQQTICFFRVPQTIQRNQTLNDRLGLFSMSRWLIASTIQPRNTISICVQVINRSPTRGT